MSSKQLGPIDPAQALDGFWDAVVERLPADSIRIPAANPEEASTVRRLHALATAPQPDAAFSNRLLTDLLDRLAERERAPDEPADTSLKVEQPTMSTIVFRSPNLFAPSRPAKHRPWFARFELVAALLVVFGFAALAIRQLPDRSSSPVTSIPAVVQTSDATPSPASGDSPIYRGDVGRSGVLPGPGPSTAPDELWRVSTGGTIESSPAVVDGTVVIGSNDGTLYALDIASGAKIWTFDAGSPVDGSPTISDGIVYVGTQNGILVAVDFSDGTEIWRFEGTREGTSPLVVDGTVFAGSWQSNTLFALDAKSGAQRWTFEADAPFIRVGAYADGIVYYPSREGVLHAVDAATGEERWSFSMDTPVDVDSPAVVNGIVYQPTYQAGNTLYAIDAVTGSELWRYSQPMGFRAPAVDADTVYLPGMNGVVTALDTATGAERWTAPLDSSIVAAPTLSNGVLYVGGQNATVSALDAATGATIWQQQVDQKIERSPAVSNGALYVGTAAGTVYAFGDGPDTGTPVVTDVAVDASPASAFDPSAVQVVWQSTGGITAFNTPGGIAQAPNGDLYVGDARNNRIVILDAETGASNGAMNGDDGKPLAFFFTGNFGYSASLGFDAAGNLYVFDFNVNEVRKYDPQGKLLQTWGTTGDANGQFQLPVGFVDAANERIYVADLINSRVQVLDLDGNYLDKWGGFGALPGQFSEPNAVTLGPDGVIYVSEDAGGRVQKFDANGVYLGVIGEPGTGPGQLIHPDSVAVDAAGNIVVADFGNGRLQIFRPDGTLIGSITSLPGYSDRLAASFVKFDGEGNLLVSDEASNSVFKLTLPPLH